MMTPHYIILVVKLIVFIAVSAVIIYSSRRCLLKPRSHGFFRFFVFELVLALILLNANYWFYEPFSALQIVSWVLLLLSLALALHGFCLLYTVGNPRSGIEDTTVLVKCGAYRYIRHPLYGSLLLLSWGLFFKNVSVPSAVLALFATAFIVVVARAEEAENLQRFGDDYVAYMKETKMFIPFVI